MAGKKSNFRRVYRAHIARESRVYRADDGYDDRRAALLSPSPPFADALVAARDNDSKRSSRVARDIIISYIIHPEASRDP